MTARDKAAGMIIGENLGILTHEASGSHERRLAWLRDLAITMMRDDSMIFGENRADEFAALFTQSIKTDSLTDTCAEYIAVQTSSQCFADKLTVCKFLAAEYGRRGTDIQIKLLGSEPYAASPRIAYFKNAYADAAFRIFSDVLDSPSVVYASDFTAVCEEVYYGRADMCMLPLDSSRDAKLISFYRLIDKYELNPVLSCDVVTPDGSVTTRYALLKRSMCLPERSARGGCFFEFSLVPDRGPALCDVLCAAKECGLSLYKIDSIPLTYNDRKFSCELIFKVGDPMGLDAFILFLSLAIPEYEPLGIYPHISTGE